MKLTKKDIKNVLMDSNNERLAEVLELSKVREAVNELKKRRISIVFTQDDWGYEHTVDNVLGDEIIDDIFGEVLK